MIPINEILKIIIAFVIIGFTIGIGLHILELNTTIWKENCNKNYGFNNWTTYQDVCPTSISLCLYCTYNKSINKWQQDNERDI